MSAERLRQAAAKMRERAAECRPVSWVQNGSNGVHTPIGQCVATTHSHDDAIRKGEAQHIASWHPAVAHAVADWLEIEAAQFGGSEYRSAALAVANAYLGDQP